MKANALQTQVEFSKRREGVLGTARSMEQRSHGELQGVDEGCQKAPVTVRQSG